MGPLYRQESFGNTLVNPNVPPAQRSQGSLPPGPALPWLVILSGLWSKRRVAGGVHACPHLLVTLLANVTSHSIFGILSVIWNYFYNAKTSNLFS